MKKNKILLCLALLMCGLILFISCGEDDGEVIDTPAEPVVIVDNGTARAVIVGNENSAYVTSVRNEISSLTGVTLEVCSADDAPEGMTRIIFGNPAEIGNDTIISEAPYFGHLVKVLDGDVYVVAYAETILMEAATSLKIKLSDGYADGVLSLDGALAASKATSQSFAAGDVPRLDGGENARIFDCGDKYQMVLLEDVESSEFSSYCEKLEGLGFELDSENDRNGNQFKTYYSSEKRLMLHTYWIEYSGEVRTVAANTDRLPINDVGGEKICAATLHTLEAITQNSDDGESGRSDGGMGYVVRTEDGRFIIFDGGCDEGAHAKAIYNYLKSNAPDPNNIVIAAWYLTHAHGDHYGAFKRFSETYSTDKTITLECVMKNFCNVGTQMKYVDDKGDRDVSSTLSVYYPTVPVYKILTGQVYTFSTTSIEILYTMSDFMPNVIVQESDVATRGEKNGDSNVMTVPCLVDIVNTADKNDLFFVMGDTTKVACDEMSKRYGDTLKCDIVQVSHHGLATDTDAPRRKNSTQEIYRLMNPDIALWPTHLDRFNERKSFSVNQCLLSLVDKNYIASNEQKTFEFK